MVLLLYNDTDSLILKIETDVYKFKKNNDLEFDAFGYKIDITVKILIRIHNTL